MNKKYIIISLLAFFWACSPIATHAASETASFCKQFDIDLKYKMAGNATIKAEIIQLQDFLNTQQLLNTPSTGYFGPLTLSAVKKFQIKYNIPATGFVGPLTRTKINSLGGCGEGLFPTIYEVTGPTSLKVNEPGTWTLTASDRIAGTLSYSVNWGEYMISSATPSASLTNTSFVQTSTFGHTYAAAGTYRITFTVRNEQTKSISQKTATVTVTDANQPQIRVTSPNGGESWNVNSVHTITWNIANNANPNAKVDLYLVEEWPSYQCPPNGSPCPAMPIRMPYVVDKNINWDAKYDWIVGTDIINNSIPRGVYKMKVCMAGLETNCDTGDALFTIVDPAYESNRAPVITGISGPTNLTGNQFGTWTVSAYDPEGGTLTYHGRWSAPSPAGLALPTNFSGTWPQDSSNAFSTSLPFGPATYTFWFTVTDSVGKSTESSITVRVN